MRFRTRLLLTMGGMILLPSLLLAWVVRENMVSRLTSQFDERRTVLTATISSRLVDISRDIDSRLEILWESVSENAEFRGALSTVHGRLPLIDPYLTQFGITTGKLTGLPVFQLQDEDGLIISSSHNPDMYGHRESSLSGLDDRVFSSRRPVLRFTDFPDERRPALVRLKKFELDGRAYLLTSGIVLNARTWEELSPAPEFTLCLLAEAAGSQNSEFSACSGVDNARSSNERLPLESGQQSISDRSADEGVFRIELIQFDATTGRIGTGEIHVQQSRAALTYLLRDIDQWLLVVLGAILGLGILSMIWVSGKMSNPLSDLLYKTSRIDLNRLNVSFKSGRKDEVGDLARVLDEMTRRLRASRTRLQDAERTLAIGEVARQVNHDIKNGLTPIRNIVQHYSQAAHAGDPELPAIVIEREASLNDSIKFLENLAGNYARLSPVLNRTERELTEFLDDLAKEYGRSRSVDLPYEADGNARVLIDEIAFRRIMENLLDNAFDSLTGDGPVRRTGGTVGVRISSNIMGGSARVLITDSGAGMNPDEIESAFKDFHTTKTNGTGLGLSIVRRLIMDMNGSISIKSARGTGTTVTLTIPLSQ